MASSNNIHLHEYYDYSTNFSITDIHHLLGLNQNHHLLINASKLEIPHEIIDNNYIVPCDYMSSPDPSNPGRSFSDHLQRSCYNQRVSDCMTVPALPEFDSCFRDFANFQQYYINRHDVFEPGDDHLYYCSPTGLMTVPNFNPAAGDYYNHELGILQGRAEGKVNEETEVKVGRYSVEEKKERILRYLKKRNQRNFNKTIKYACRKTLADKRIRIRGRFAKNGSTEASDDHEEEEMMIKATDHTSYSDETNSFYEDSSFLQMKYDEEEWFETAMANLMHLPYNTPA